VISRFRQDLGFSAVELLFVVAIIGGMAAIGVPISNAIIDDVKLKGDAQTLSAAVARTKMASSAKFTHSRLRVNLNTYPSSRGVAANRCSGLGCRRRRSPALGSRTIRIQLGGRAAP
jgi:prepilin-type N-terminal cleavage/methylation domain-containing protein